MQNKQQTPINDRLVDDFDCLSPGAIAARCWFSFSFLYFSSVLLNKRSNRVEKDW